MSNYDENGNLVASTQGTDASGTEDADAAAAAQAQADADAATRAQVENAALEQRNADLRAELQAENDRLQDALEASRAATRETEGLTDEDVRRIEHPAEFVDEPAAATVESQPSNTVGTAVEQTTPAQP